MTKTKKSIAILTVIDIATGEEFIATDADGYITLETISSTGERRFVRGGKLTADINVYGWLINEGYTIKTLDIWVETDGGWLERA